MHHVAGHHLLDCDLDFGARAHDAGGLHLQLHETLDRLGGPPLGDRFQEAAEKDQRDDHAGGLEIGRRRAGGEDLRHDERQQRIEIGG